MPVLPNSISQWSGATLNIRNAEVVDLDATNISCATFTKNGYTIEEIIGSETGADLTALENKTQNIDPSTYAGYTLFTGNVKTDTVEVNDAATVGSLAVGTDISAANISLSETTYTDYLSVANRTTTDSLTVISDRITLGGAAGQINQSTYSIAIGSEAGYEDQGGTTGSVGFSVAIGTQAGRDFQATDSIAIGSNAGQTTQSTTAIAIGSQAGVTTQGIYGIAVGRLAGNLTQGADSVAIGWEAGKTTQGSDSIAIGTTAGKTTQGVNNVAIGNAAGTTSQTSRAVAIGASAGNSSQGDGTVAIGLSAGQTTQGTSSVAVGPYAATSTQGLNSVAVGYEAGRVTQGNNAVALGRSAGKTTQSGNGVAIGYQAGMTSQGSSAVAIGSNAATTNQHTNSVVINGSGSALETDGTSRCFIAPIREATSTNYLYYNPTSKEITSSATTSLTNPTISGDITMSSYSNFKIYPRVYYGQFTASGTSIVFVVPSWATRVTVVLRGITWGATTTTPKWTMGKTTGTPVWTGCAGICRTTGTSVTTALSTAAYNGMVAWSGGVANPNTWNSTTTFTWLHTTSGTQYWNIQGTANIINAGGGAVYDGNWTGAVNDVMDNITFVGHTTVTFTGGTCQAIFE